MQRKAERTHWVGTSEGINVQLLYQQILIMELLTRISVGHDRT